MGKRDKRIKAYIEKSQPFAKPILNHLRDLVHNACPEVEETVKWGMPAFDYQGPLCNMAAFKQHAVFGFWKASLMKDSGKLKDNQHNAMGHLGKVSSMSDLPADKTIISWIKDAMKLNEECIKLPPKKKTEIKDIVIPDYFTKALSKNKPASKGFDAFSPSHKKEYVQWITEAKTEETRNRRMETALLWIAEGKGRNWKYQNK